MSEKTRAETPQPVLPTPKPIQEAAAAPPVASHSRSSPPYAFSQIAVRPEAPVLAAKAVEGHVQPAGPSVEAQLRASEGQGQALPEDAQAQMEAHLGHDFSQVRVHADDRAADMNRSLNAHAFTHGQDVYFAQGKYNPQAEEGKKLLAHELTHVVQQSQGVHLQAAGERPPLLLNVTEEVIDLSHDESLAKTPDTSALERLGVGVNPALEPEEESEVMFVQAQPAPAPAVPPPPPPRTDWVFLMGADAFYVAAKKFFQDHYPDAQIVSPRDRSLAGIFAELRKVASDAKPVGNLYIVSHANVDGTLSFGLTKKDRDSKTTFGELRNALVTSPQLFQLAGGIDANTQVHIKGCNIGRNLDMLGALDEAFGGDVTVDAPTHKQTYEYRRSREGRKIVTTTREYFNTYNVEYLGNVDKSTDDLIDDFSARYAELGLTAQDWEIAILGVRKHTAKVDTAARREIADVNKQLAADIKALDRKAPDYKDEVKRLRDEAKASREGILGEAKKSKETKAAKGSGGVSRKVTTPFTATLFDGTRPPREKADILKAAPRWFLKAYRQGWTFTSAAVAVTRNGGRETFDYTLEAEKKDQEGTFQYSIEMDAFPKDDADAQVLAELKMEDYADAHPDFAVARREMFEWRITRSNKGARDTVKAYLEMTAYTIDLDLKDQAGNIIEPSAHEGEALYFGETD